MKRRSCSLPLQLSRQLSSFSCLHLMREVGGRLVTVLLTLVASAAAYCDNNTWAAASVITGCQLTTGGTCTNTTICLGALGDACRDGTCAPMNYPYNASCFDTCGPGSLQCVNGNCLVQSAATNDPCTVRTACFAGAGAPFSQP